ncbi:MAG: ABC transporter ATP-binding protein [Vicinamibacterales bacterium]
MLRAVDVRFGYGRPGRRHAAGGPDGRDALVLDGLSVEVRAGGFVGLLGPNGAGKSTFLKLVAGVLRPDAGRVELDGRETASIPRGEIARRLAVVPQETELAFDYTVLEIVLMGRYPHLGAFAIEGPDDVAVAMDSLEATGTAPLAERSFRTLSGGERQRVVIASALAQLAQGDGSRSVGRDPLLLLDEPTASLDLRYQLEVAALLRRLHDTRGVTIVVSTHDLRFAESICTEIVMIGGGRVVAHGRPDEVLTADRVGEVYGIPAATVAPLLR